MDLKEFAGLVKQMRSKQKEYFETRNLGVLEQSKAWERRIDSEVERILSPQKELFSE